MKSILKIINAGLLVVLFAFQLNAMNNDTLNINNTSSKVIDTNRIYSSYEVDRVPMYPGGNDSLKAFIDRNLRLNNAQSEFEGYVFLSIKVDWRGEVDFLNIFGLPETDLFNESLKNLVSKMKEWEPGHLSNKKVNTLICIPIIIKITDR